MIKLLLLEDEEHMRRLLKKRLEAGGYRVDEAVDIKTAARKIQQGEHDIYIMDLVLPDGSSISLLEQFPDKTASRTIIITANPSTSSVVEAIKKGAFNYLEKPVNIQLLNGQVDKIIEINDLKNRYQSVVGQMTSTFTFDSIIHESRQMEAVIKKARILAGTDNTVLIHGETGVGKEVLSHALHNHSLRRNNIFLPLNCAAIPHEL
ncbi:MAG: sigma-54-dependent Fis family transcriptional regulator, partial [bacterium]|nr:sigma-54-dependent Fis family transcriptional regulator [bacterium]